ncbi:MAG: hypothetical protein H0V84_01705 [Actinobacteria bacterium]|nr:hypothetical protein [Actinomycetota bacterium]
MSRLLIAAVCLASLPAAAAAAPTELRDGKAPLAIAGAAAGRSGDLAHARKIRAQINRRYLGPHGPKLAVTEASSTGVFESFSLLTTGLDEMRVIPADNGIYFAICPLRATCPYPARRAARPAEAFLPRRQALELALRTFIETSADVVAVSLPTARFVLFIAERQELAREADLPALATALAGDPAIAADASLRRSVDQLTYSRLFVPLGLEPTPTGRDTFTAMPLWPAGLR